jgi:hypothetical protein
MLSEIGALFAVLLAIYLLDCLVWGPGIAYAFRARPSGDWRPTSEVFAMLQGRRRVWLAGLVPGSGGIALTETAPPPFAPMGICACDTVPGAIGKPIPWEDLALIFVGEHSVRDRGRDLVPTVSATFAVAVAEWMSEVARSPLERRAERIEKGFERMLDTGAARAALDRYHAGVRPLVWPVRVLALVMFVAAPVAIIRGGLVALIPLGLAVLAAVVGVVAFYVARMKAVGQTNAVWRNATTMILAPPAALRADDLAGREFLARFHALCVARVACAEGMARALTAATLRETRHPLAFEPPPCCEASAWSRRTWQAVLERWAGREFGSLERLLAPPRRETDRMQAYCPRCHQQYERAEGECSDCAGLALKRFEPEPSAREAQ